MDSVQAYDDAVSLHQQGQWRKAEEIYGVILEAAPDHLGALCGLGAIRRQQGRLDDAIQLYRRAAGTAPRSADTQMKLGVIFAALNHPNDAIACYRAVLAIRPNHTDAHNSLGNALLALGRAQDAIPHYQRILRIRKDHAEAHNNLASALWTLNRPQEAVKHLRRAIASKPAFVNAHCNLALVLTQLNQHEEAIACYESALAIQPDFAAAHNHLGNVLQKLGRMNEAAGHYQRALGIKPDYAEAHRNLGDALRALNRYEEALAHYEQSLAAMPAQAEVYNNIGGTHHILGRFEDAYRAFEQAVALAPRKAAILLNFAALKPFTTASDPRLSALEALAAPGTSLDADDEIAMHFALGRAFADLGQHDRAFRHFVTGNALKRRRLIYDEADTLQTFARIRAVFGRGRIAEPGGDPSELPVFVVGMPRSGTTLIEQILASHSKVFGAGEREDIPALASTLTAPRGAKFPEAAATLMPGDWRRLGARYLEALRAAAPAAERIVDKMPLNFLYLGLIHLALPRARIIHVRRDPVDTCWSCFSRLFSGNLVFTYELGELGRYYRAYERLMAHWRAVLPKDVMLEVAYEDVVDDLEGQTRALLAHCGLEWEAACLSFHETQRPVQTSIAEVRRPIYRGSVGHSRHYRPHLGALLEALTDSCEIPGA
jgi:tetratricopeptide (TPR) repeat protein